jgi:hypothetical protein
MRPFARISSLLFLLMLFLILPLTRAQDDTIASGTPVTVDLTSTTDLSYTAAGPERITVTAHSLDGVLDTTLEVYDSNGNMLDTNDDATASLPGLGPTDSAIQNLSLPEAGNYMIRVSSFTGAESGQVEISVTSAAEQIVSGDLAGKVLFTSEPLKVYLTGQQAIDLVYEAASREIVSVYARSLDINPIPTDTTLEILNSDGDQVAFNDDLNDTSIDPGIENVSLDPGVYTIRLDTYDSSQVGGVQVEMVLGEVEPTGDGGTSSGTSLEFGDTANGTITDTSIDVYSFVGEAGQDVTITAEASNPASPDQDLELRLYGPDGEQITSDDDSGSEKGLGDRDPAIISFTLPDDGEYSVEVDAIFDISGDYTISLEEG